MFWWGDVFHIQTVSTRNNTFQCRRMFRKVAVNCIEITKVYNKSFICLTRGQLPHPRERTYLQRKNLSAVARQGLIATQRYRCRRMATLRLRIITGNTTRLLRACAFHVPFHRRASDQLFQHRCVVWQWHVLLKPLLRSQGKSQWCCIYFILLSLYGLYICIFNIKLQ